MDKSVKTPSQRCLSCSLRILLAAVDFDSQLKSRISRQAGIINLLGGDSFVSRCAVEGPPKRSSGQNGFGVA